VTFSHTTSPAISDNLCDACTSVTFLYTFMAARLKWNCFQCYTQLSRNCPLQGFTQLE